MSIEHPHDSDVEASPTTIHGTHSPVEGKHTRAFAKRKAEELVLLARSGANLAIVVREGEHTTQYREVIAPNGQRQWVRIAEGSPAGIAEEFVPPSRSVEGTMDDDIIPVWADTASKRVVIEELLGAIAHRGHPLQDQLPDIRRADAPTPTVEVLPVEDAPELPCSPHRAFEGRSGAHR